MMKILIDQPAGFGDIFFCQKIAAKLMEQGHEVYWDVIPEYQYIEKYIRNGIIWGVTGGERNDICTLDIYQATNHFKFSKSGELNYNIMQSKYRYANQRFNTGGWENWQDYLKITRNYEEEKILERDILKNIPKEFSLICNHFATDYQLLNNPVISEYPTIEIRKIPKVNLFWWCGLIERAAEIRIPDSSYPYLVEILDTTDKLYMYHRNNERGILTKPIWKKEWKFIE